MFSRRYCYRYLLNKNLMLIGKNEEVEVDEDTVEVEEFEEIEDEEDEEEPESQDIPIERINVNIVNRNEGPSIPMEPMMERISNNQERFLASNEDFDEKFIKKYCLESGTITQLPIMNVIRKIEFFILIPNEI